MIKFEVISVTLSRFLFDGFSHQSNFQNIAYGTRKLQKLIGVIAKRFEHSDGGRLEKTFADWKIQFTPF